MKSTITIAALSFLVVPSFAFQTRGPVSARNGATKLAVLGPEHANDLHSILSDSPAWSLLADAAQAALDAPTGGDVGSMADLLSQDIPAVSQEDLQIVDAVAEAAKDEGLWKSYLKIFKGALTLIHDTIDGPLRNAGIEQTWGISIAIFTACKFRSANLCELVENKL